MTNGRCTQVDTVTVLAAARLERRGGRKLIIAPDGGALAPALRRDVEILALGDRGQTLVETRDSEGGRVLLGGDDGCHLDAGRRLARGSDN